MASSRPTVTGGRLADRMEERGVDQPALAAALGVSQGAISQIITGRTRNSRLLPRIADYLECSLAWLLGTSDEKLPASADEVSDQAAARQLDAVLVPLIGHSFGMGGGQIDNGEAVEGHVTFSRAWLRGRIEGTMDDVVLITGEGDSMEPTIRSGDVLLVDRAQRIVRQQDQIWAVALRELGMVKRLRRVRGAVTRS